MKFGPRSDYYLDRIASREELEIRKLRQDLQAAQIQERPESVLWLDGWLGRFRVDSLVSRGLLETDGGKPNFLMKQSEVGRLFGESEFTEWTEIADHVLVDGKIPNPETLRKGFQRNPRL